MINTGIIAEYNPLHNGHIHHINETKKINKTDNLICIMSGNFIQRGLPASYDKWTRTKMAINAGIDLVIELPTYYAVNSAEYFSSYAVKILNSLNCLNYLSFGSEEKELDKLKTISNLLINETEEFKYNLKQELDKGLSFPKARENATMLTLNDNSLNNILNKSNNILAIEYLKELGKSNSKITPINIPRINNNYNDETITDNISSATSIRKLLNKKLITENEIEILEQLVPNTTFELMKENIISTYLNDLKRFEKEILFLIKHKKEHELQNILEVTEGLENRLKKYCYETDDIYEYISLIKTKRFTETKIQRILIHILLNMTKTEFNEIQENIDKYMYIRVLGFNNKGKELLKQISKNTNISIITSVKKYIDITPNNPLLQKDILASNIYCNKHNIDYTEKIVNI
ncbi:MAG: nucleotidyltransferase [Clostridiales bacterium]|nr:nucleotidyltransferase [Clostridiales bacterium]